MTKDGVYETHIAKESDNNKQTIIFDLGGVIIDLDVPRSVQAFKELISADDLRDVLGMDIDGNGTEAVSVATRQLMSDYERGDIPTETFFGDLQRYSKPGTTMRQLQDAWLKMLGEIPAWRIAYLKQLKQQGYRLFLLSNSNELHWNTIFRQYPLAGCFERIFASHELHIAKPEPEIFRLVNNAVGPTANSIIYVDDLEKNRLAAEQCVGWKTYSSIDELRKYL